MPDVLPSIDDLERGVRTIELQFQQVDENHAKRCFAKLLTTFEPNTKMATKETRVRFAAFYDACFDIPGDLWEIATQGCCQALKWFPKPVEFRDQVRPELDERSKRQRQVREMLEAARNAPPAPPPVPEARSAVLAMLIKSALSRDDKPKALIYETELAALENRPLADWAQGPITIAKRDAHLNIQLPVISPLLEAETLRAVAKHHSGTKYAQRLLMDADGLSQMPRQWTDKYLLEADYDAEPEAPDFGEA